MNVRQKILVKYLSKYFLVRIKITSLVEIPSLPGRRELPIVLFAANDLEENTRSMNSKVFFLLDPVEWQSGHFGRTWSATTIFKQPTKCGT